MSERAASVLLVDDDADLRDALAMALELGGLAPRAVADGAAALTELGHQDFDVVVSDIRMPGLDGRQLLQRLLSIDPDLPVVLITGHGDIEQAVTALRQGAYDFLAKPFATERLLETVRRAVEKRQLLMENRRLRSIADAQSARTELALIGDSPAIRRLAHTIDQLSGTQVDVLIEGEWGVGKQAVARLLARSGKGKDTPIHLFDCEALPEALIEQFLFGIGGNDRARRGGERGGALAKASGGTLVLAGVDALPLGVQSRLLHSLAHRDLAADKNPPTDSGGWSGGPARIVSTTTTKLAERVASGQFRSELYFRLAPVSLIVPPLRERRADIPLIFMQLLEAAARHYQRPVPALTDAMLARLTDHDWPGNLRELQNFAEQAILNLGRAETRLDGDDRPSLPERVARFEAEALRAALSAERGRIGPSCARLGIPRKTLYDKLAKYGIAATDFRS